MGQAPVTQSELLVLGAWLVFGLSHILLSTQGIRARLVNRFGEARFVLFYVLFACLSFAVLVYCYANARATLAPLLLPANNDWVLISLTGAVVLGLILMCFCIIGYVNYPMAAFAQSVNAPTGITRVTRHPFLMGNVFFFGAHFFLGPTLLDKIFFGGFVVLALVGIIHQDAKQARNKGQAYTDFLAATSAIPFLAILRGKQKFVAREISLIPIAIGLLMAVALRSVHDAILSYSGVFFIAAMIIVGAGETFLAWRIHGRRT